MKNTLGSNPIAPPTSSETAVASRYHIYRQTHMGTYAVEFKTDSPVEAVEAFLKQSPVFEGGEIRLWNQRQQRLCASVKWSMEASDSSGAVFRRENVFHDRLLGLIARQVQVREEIREEIHHSIRMSA